MKPSEIRELTVNQIQDMVKASKKELMELRFQAAVGQLTNSARIHYLRKHIAQLLTIASEKNKNHLESRG